MQITFPRLSDFIWYACYALSNVLIFFLLSLPFVACFNSPRRYPCYLFLIFFLNIFCFYSSSANWQYCYCSVSSMDGGISFRMYSRSSPIGVCITQSFLWSTLILFNFKKRYPNSTGAYSWDITITLIIYKFYNEQTEEIFNLTHSVATLFFSPHVLPNCCGSCKWNYLSLNKDATSLHIKTIGYPPLISIVVEWRRI